MYSAGVIKKDGHIEGKAFQTKEEAENFILSFAELNLIKQGRIRNLKTGETEILNFEEKHL